ncbi:MAG: TIGR02266 family protein [bacterium]|nr:TIGR02266 family protein [bacterium]
MDKRERPRILISLEITYESGDDFVSSFLSDISGGGVFIGTTNPLGVNTRLKVCFHVPGISESLLATGTVAWVRDPVSSDKPGMGVRFDEMEPGDQEKLDRFFSEHEEGKGGRDGRGDPETR